MEVYLDNSATTMCYPDVGELVYKVMCQDYGNPSSMHKKGVQAEHYTGCKRNDSPAAEGKCKRAHLHIRRNGE